MPKKKTFLLVSLNEAKAKKLAQVISNATCRKIMDELAKGKSLDEAMKITREDVAESLDGLPPVKMHCSNLAADGLHEAIKKYREKQET